MREKPIGTLMLDKNGYLRRKILLENNKTKWVIEHRRVIEEFIGRILNPKENVHHINGNKLDNSKENLEIWSTNHPPGQKLEDKIKWAKEFLKSYGYRIEAA